MKATVISVLKSKKYTVHYYYHNTKKCNDDCEDISVGDAIVPMMEIRLWKDNFNPLKEKGIKTETQIVFATPQIIEKYTGFNLFDFNGFYCFEGVHLDIEFEWIEEQYPYLKTYHPRDYIDTEIFKYPRIKSIGDINYVW